METEDSQAHFGRVVASVAVHPTPTTVSAAAAASDITPFVREVAVLKSPATFVLLIAGTKVKSIKSINEAKCAQC